MSIKSGMARAIEPKSDQINADDLVSGDIVITITGVKISEGEQPISISFEGSAKFFRPSKTTARTMVQVWGDPEDEPWVGKSLRLYRDPDVTWAGVKIGGIRIREMSGLTKPVTVAVTEKRGQRKVVTIRPLSAEAPELAAARQGTEYFREWWNTAEGKAARQKGAEVTDEVKRLCAEADAATPRSLEDRLRQEPETDEAVTEGDPS